MNTIMIIQVSFSVGSDIREAAECAKNLAIKNNCAVEFNFNGVNIIVNENSDITQTVEDYFKAIKQ